MVGTFPGKTYETTVLKPSLRSLPKDLLKHRTGCKSICSHSMPRCHGSTLLNLICTPGRTKIKKVFICLCLGNAQDLHFLRKIFQSTGTADASTLCSLKRTEAKTFALEVTDSLIGPCAIHSELCRLCKGQLVNIDFRLVGRNETSSCGVVQSQLLAIAFPLDELLLQPLQLRRICRFHLQFFATTEDSTRGSLGALRFFTGICINS